MLQRLVSGSREGSALSKSGEALGYASASVPECRLLHRPRSACARGEPGSPKRGLGTRAEKLVESRGVEPLTSTMPLSRSTN